jgi:hypothetical protein
MQQNILSVEQEKLIEDFFRKEFNLDHIQDSEELKLEVQKRMDKLNPLDEAAVKMKLGTLLDEYKAGPGFQKRKKIWFLIIMLIMFGISFLCFWLMNSFEISLIYKIILVPIAILTGLLGLRTFYNLLKGKY